MVFVYLEFNLIFKERYFDLFRANIVIIMKEMKLRADGERNGQDVSGKELGFSVPNSYYIVIVVINY